MTDDASETEDLLRRAKAGDESALAALFSHYRERLKRMVRLRLDRRLSGRIDASDVLQEAYLEAHKRLPQCTENELPFFLWLRLVTGQKLTDLHRHHLGAKMRDAGQEVSLYRGALPEATSASLAAQLLGKLTTATQAAVRAEQKLLVQEALNSMDPRRPPGQGGPRAPAPQPHPRPHLGPVAVSHSVWDMETEQRVTVPKAATSAAWSPDGKRLAVGSQTGNITLMDFPAGTEAQQIRFPTSVLWLTFSPDGSFLAIAGGTKARVWDCREKAFVTGELVHPARVDSLVFNPRGDRLATGCQDAQVRLFAVAGNTTEPLFPPLPHSSWQPYFHGSRPILPQFIDEGRQLLTMAEKQLIWSDAEKGTKIRSIPAPALHTAALRVHGKYAAVSGGMPGHGKVQIFDVASGQAIGPVLTHRNTVVCMAFSPDGKTLLTGSLDRSVRLWAVPSGEPLAQPLVHPASVLFVAFSPDSRFLVTAQEGGQVRLWAFPSSDPRGYRVPLAGKCSFAHLSSDGKNLLAGGMSSRLGSLASTRVFDLVSGQPAGPPLRPGAKILDAAFSPEGRQVAMICGREDQAPRVHLWDWKTGAQTAPPLALPSEPRSLDYRSDGLCLAVYCAGGHLVLVDPKAGRTLRQWQVPANTAPPSHYIHGNGAVRFGPDGQRIFVWGTQAGIGVYDARTGKPHPSFDLDLECHDVRFSADGQLVVVSSFDGTARLFQYSTGRAVVDPLQHPDWVFDAQFSPDGQYLLTTCRDGMVRVWDWKKRQLVSPPLEHRDEVHPAAFTPDGCWVVTASLDRTARVWDWRTGMPVIPPLPLSGRGLNVAVTPDSRYAVVGGFVDALEVICLRDLSDDEELDADDLCLWAELLCGQRVHEGGGVTNLTAEEWLDRWQRFHPRHPGFGVPGAGKHARP